MRFVQLGRLLATPGALSAIEATGETPLDFLLRHVRGDWGDVDFEDKRTNDDALAFGNRILSSYRLKDRTHIWIITEADRSVTTVLLPEEY